MGTGENKNVNNFRRAGAVSDEDAVDVNAGTEAEKPVIGDEPVKEAPTDQKIDVASLSDEQIRKASIGGLKETPMAGTSGLSDEQVKVKRKLAAAPKVRFMLPFDPGEKRGAFRSVTINGYRCEVPKGVFLDLPEPIVKILMRSMQMESDALESNQYNLSNADASTRAALKL